MYDKSNIPCTLTGKKMATSSGKADQNASISSFSESLLFCSISLPGSCSLTA